MAYVVGGRPAKAALFYVAAFHPGHVRGCMMDEEAVSHLRYPRTCGGVAWRAICITLLFAAKQLGLRIYILVSRGVEKLVGKEVLCRDRRANSIKCTLKVGHRHGQAYGAIAGAGVVWPASID